MGRPTSRSSSWPCLQAIPGLVTLRPADANETAEAWRIGPGARATRPACLVLSRQALPTLDRSIYAPASGLARGAYVLADAEGREPAVILIASGSEVALCVEAHRQLVEAGVPARVVSMPSMELFEDQDQAYRDQVLPPHIHGRVAVEAAAALGWDRYVDVPLGLQIIAMRSFGASAPIADLQTKFGFTVQHVYEAARRQAEP